LNFVEKKFQLSKFNIGKYIHEQQKSTFLLVTQHGAYIFGVDFSKNEVAEV